MTTAPGRIEKQVTLRAPLARVWRAVSDAKEFGVWFGVSLEGPFVAGKGDYGAHHATQVDPAVAETQKTYEGTKFEILVEKIDRRGSSRSAGTRSASTRRATTRRSRRRSLNSCSKRRRGGRG